MLNISRFVSRTPFLTKPLITKRYAAVNILGYDLYKQWYLGINKDSETNILSRNTLVAKSWKKLNTVEKDNWILKAKLMTDNMIETRKQIYESRQFSIFSRIFCFHNIPGIIEEFKANNHARAYDPLYEGKLKILELFLSAVNSGGNRVEIIKNYIQQLNSLKIMDLSNVDSPEMKKIQELLPETSPTDIFTIWESLMSDVHDLCVKHFDYFSSGSNNAKILVLFFKYLQRMVDRVPNARVFIRDLDRITSYANGSNSRFEIFFAEQFPVIENPYEFMINFKKILAETYVKYIQLTEEEIEILDKKSLELERYPIIQHGTACYKKNLPYQLYVKESFYKKYFDSIIAAEGFVTNNSDSKTFKDYNYEDSEDIEVEDIEAINEKAKKLTRKRGVDSLNAFIDLNKEWLDMSKNVKKSEYWQKMIKKFDEDGKKYVSPFDSDMIKLMGTIRTFDQAHKFTKFTPSMFFAELNFPGFEKYLNLSSTRHKNISLAKNKVLGKTSPKRSGVRTFDISDPVNDDLKNGNVFFNLYERTFETYYDCFELENTFKRWDSLTEEEECRYLVLFSVLRFLKGSHIFYRTPSLYGKKLSTKDFTYVLNTHMDISYLKEIYPYKNIDDLKYKSEWWPQIHAKRASALKRFLAESLDIFKYRNKVDEKSKTNFRLVVIHSKSIKRSMEAMYKTEITDEIKKGLTYGQFFHSRRDEALNALGFENIDDFISSFDNSIDLYHGSVKLITSQIKNYETYLEKLIIQNGFKPDLPLEVQSAINFKNFNSVPKIYYKLFGFVNRSTASLLQDCIEESIVKGKQLTKQDIIGDEKLPAYKYENSKNKKLYEHLMTASMISELKANDNYVISTSKETNPAKFRVLQEMGSSKFFKNVLKKFPYETPNNTILRVEHNGYMYAYRNGSLQKYVNDTSSTPVKFDCSFLVDFREAMFNEQLFLYNKIKKDDPTSNVLFSDVFVPERIILRLLDVLEKKHRWIESSR